MKPALDQIKSGDTVIALADTTLEDTQVAPVSRESRQWLDLSFRITPQIHGSTRLLKNIQTVTNFHLSLAAIEDPKLLEHKNWASRWQFHPSGCEDAVLNTQTRSLSQDLRQETTVYLAKGLLALERLLTPHSDPTSSEILSDFSHRLEKSYASALQILHGVARINSFYRSERFDEQEEMLLLQSTDGLLNRANWGHATFEHAQETVANLKKQFLPKLSILEGAVSVHFCNYLEKGLATLWDLIDVRAAQLPNLLNKKRAEHEARLFDNLRRSLSDSKAYKLVAIKQKGAIIVEDEAVEQILTLARLFKLQDRLLTQERNFYFAAMEVSSEAQELHKRRIANCYGDFESECKQIFSTLLRFRCQQPQLDLVVGCINNIRDYQRTRHDLSEQLIKRFNHSFNGRLAAQPIGIP